MSNKLSPESLDSSFGDYDPGAVVIGQESYVNGAIGAVAAHRIPSKRWEGVNGGRARLITGPQDTELILQVNEHADALMSNQAWQQQNPDVTRGGLVHNLLEQALTAKYGVAPTEAKRGRPDGGSSAIYGQAEPIDMVEPIPQAPWLNVPPPQIQQPQPQPPQLQLRPQVVIPQAQVQRTAVDVQSAVRQQAVPQPIGQAGPAYGSSGQSLLAAATFGSLGIADLGVTPFKAKYAVLVDQAGKQHRLRWHWIQRIEEEACLLIYDSRRKPVSSDKLQRLVSVRAMSLYWGETEATVASGMSLNLVPSVQTFRFGCFVFYYFLLAE